MSAVPTSASPLIRGMNHTSYTVSDIDRVLAFLIKGLGFTLTSRSPREPDAMQKGLGVPGAELVIAHVQAPGHRIELIDFLAPADRGHPDIRPCDTGFSHLAFDVTDIDAVIRVGAEYGFSPIHDPLLINGGPNDGFSFAYLRDRNGLTMELIGPRA